MIVIHKLDMDLTRRGTPHRIDVVQDDKYSRDLSISLFSSGIPWEPETGVSAIVNYVKPDGTGGSYNFLPNEKPAWRIRRNVVTVALAPQVCTAPGRVMLAVSLVKDAAEINTFAIELEVHHNPGLSVTSEDYYNVSGTLPNFGWEPGMLLGTDTAGNVVAVEAPDVGVLTVNGAAPDEAGNVEIEMSGIQTINGVGPDENGNLSMSISTLPRPATAEVGQYLRVLAVDDTGQITALEAVDPDASEAAGTYLYNGVELPALPEWDNKAYPYALIEHEFNGGNSSLYVSDKPMGIANKDLWGDVLCAENQVSFAYKDGYMRYNKEFQTDFEFRFETDSSITIVTGGRHTILWANHDLMDWDAGTVLVAASDPVPAEAEETPSGGIPTVIITSMTAMDTDPVTLTDEECAQLTAACAEGLPFVIRFEMSDAGIVISGIPSVFCEPETGAYYCTVSGPVLPDDVGNIFHHSFTLTNFEDNGIWTAALVAMYHTPFEE